MRHAPGVEVSATDRRQLEVWARSDAPGRRLALRAQIVLEAAEGLPNALIAAHLGVQPETAARWRSRFALNGLEGLAREAPRGGAGARVPRATVRRIVRATLGRSPSSGARWTTRSLAQSLRVNHMLVHRVWATHGLRARRPPGPETRPRVDLAGAFVTPAVRAVVFTVDERPEPLPGPWLPELDPNPTGRLEFSGPRSSSRELVRAVEGLAARPGVSDRGPTQESALLVFLRGVERTAPRRSRLEVVFDRPLARLGGRLNRWLSAHGRFRAFTAPGLADWPRAVESWLSRWEPGGVDRASLGEVAAFVRQVEPVDAGRGVRPPAVPRFSWRSAPRQPVDRKDGPARWLPNPAAGPRKTRTPRVGEKQ